MSTETREELREGAERQAGARAARPGAMPTYLALVRALWLSWTRDKAQVFFNLLLPLLFLVLLVTVYGSNATPASKVLVVGEVPVLDQIPDVELENADFDFTEIADMPAAVERLESGEADALIAQDGDLVSVYWSQTNGMTGELAGTKLRELVEIENVDVLSEAAPGEPVLKVATAGTDDRSLDPVQYLAPGMLAWGIAIAGVFGAAGTIVDLKRDKLIRRLRVTPASAGRFIAARISVSLLVVLLQTVVFLTIAAVLLGLDLSVWTWFAVPLVLLGTFSFLAMGVIVGTIAKTSPGAAGLSNLVTMPMAFVSGAFYAVEALPGWMHWISQVSPMTHLNLAMQSVVSLGEPPSAVLGHIAYLAAFAVVMSLVAWKTFKFDEL